MARRYGLVVAIAAIVIGLDQASKSWAVSSLSEFRTREVIGSAGFRLAFNSGIAFSKGQGLGPLIPLVGLLIVAALLWFVRSITSLPQRIAVGVVMGGALGNIVDRLVRSPAPGASGGFLHGAVVDFIYLRWWPTFNVADSSIVVGGIVLAILLLLEPSQPDDALPRDDGSVGGSAGTTGDRSSDAESSASS